MENVPANIVERSVLIKIFGWFILVNGLGFILLGLYSSFTIYGRYFFVAGLLFIIPAIGIIRIKAWGLVTFLIVTTLFWILALTFILDILAVGLAGVYTVIALYLLFKWRTFLKNN